MTAETAETADPALLCRFPPCNCVLNGERHAYRPCVLGDATSEQALAAVDDIAPANELIDLDPAPTGSSEVLAGNVFHRHWITGTFDTARAASNIIGLVGHVTIMGTTLAPVTDLEAAAGPADEVLAEVARIAARHGRGLRAGDVVILGSIVPPTANAPRGAVHYVLGDAPALEVTLTE